MVVENGDHSLCYQERWGQSKLQSERRQTEWLGQGMLGGWMSDDKSFPRRRASLIYIQQIMLDFVSLQDTIDCQVIDWWFSKGANKSMDPKSPNYKFRISFRIPLIISLEYPGFSNTPYYLYNNFSQFSIEFIRHIDSYNWCWSL